jgi:hypothetical protein
MVSTLIAGLSAAGSLIQGNAQRAAANAEAAAAEQNARLADEQARDAVRRGGYEELKLRRQASMLQGTQRAQAAAAGVDVASGSALDAQIASLSEGEQDAAVIRFNAQREAWGYGVQATNYRNAARAAKASGRNAMTAGILGAGTSLLTAAQPYPGKTGSGAGTSAAWGIGTSAQYVPPDSIVSRNLKQWRR